MASTVMATTTTNSTGTAQPATTATALTATSTNNVTDMKRIMESMGWSDGTFIPIANDDNKELMKSMQALLAHKEQSLNTHQQTKQRVTSLEDRLKRACDDNTQNGSLLEAHRSQMSDEHHMFKVSEHTDQTLTKRLKELQKTLTDLQNHDHLTNGEIHFVIVLCIV